MAEFKFTEEFTLVTRQHWKCRRWYGVTRDVGSTECPYCLNEEIKTQQHENEKLKRQVIGLRGAIKRMRKARP